jgi:DNA-binding transcriptional ArsR family regulator
MRVTSGYLISDEEAKELGAALAVVHSILPVALLMDQPAPAAPRMIVVGRPAKVPARAKPSKVLKQIRAQDGAGSTTSAIIAELTGVESKSTKEIYAALGKSPSAVSSALTMLKKSGAIAKAGYGRWKLAAVKPAQTAKTPPAAAVVPAKSSRLGLIARLDRKLKDQDPLAEAHDLARREASEG